MTIEEKVREILEDLVNTVTYSEEDINHLTDEEIENKWKEATQAILELIKPMNGV